ncbi:MAG: hypothetical protein ABI867_16885 [Kofleriaceae bacterium]
MRMHEYLLPFCMLIVGCASPETADDDIDPPGGASALRVELSAHRIDWVDGTAAAPTVHVTRIAADGSETDVTSAATLTVTPVELAAVTNAEIVASGTAAGPGTVIASVDGLSDDDAFEVFVTKTLPGSGDPSTAALFDTATAEPSTALAIAYPPADAMIPPNLGEMDVHWRDTAGKDVYEVMLASHFVTLKTYVATLGAATFQTLAPADWTMLSSGSHGTDLTVRVRGLATAAPATFIESTEQVRIAAEQVRGGVYYWNTTRSAIMRFDMTAQATPPEQFYPAVGQSGCVGCHAVSRDGSVVAYRSEGDNMNYGNALAVSSLQKQLPENTQRWNFAAVHPDNSELFTTTTTGLYRTVLATGATTPLYTGGRISHPDVAANGTQIVATALTGGSEVWTSASSLVVFDYDTTARTVGAPRTLVPQTGAAFPYYPAFSPDNAWVLYNQATGGTSYDNRNAELWVTKADGSSAPIRMSAAEQAASYDSWPKWTPFMNIEPTATASEPVMWFTVASRRPFGVRSTANQKPQLWLAPFYPERAAAGQPATGPAIRMPFQDLAQGNHIAQWAEEIVTIQ